MDGHADRLASCFGRSLLMAFTDNTRAIRVKAKMAVANASWYQSQPHPLKHCLAVKLNHQAVTNRQAFGTK